MGMAPFIQHSFLWYICNPCQPRYTAGASPTLWGEGGGGDGVRAGPNGPLGAVTLQ